LPRRALHRVARGGRSTVLCWPAGHSSTVSWRETPDATHAAASSDGDSAGWWRGFNFALPLRILAGTDKSESTSSCKPLLLASFATWPSRVLPSGKDAARAPRCTHPHRRRR